MWSQVTYTNYKWLKIHVKGLITDVYLEFSGHHCGQALAREPGTVAAQGCPGRVGTSIAP